MMHIASTRVALVGARSCSTSIYSSSRIAHLTHSAAPLIDCRTARTNAIHAARLSSASPSTPPSRRQESNSSNNNNDSNSPQSSLPDHEPPPSPQLLRGVDEFMQTLQRCRARNDVLAQYTRAGVFAPSLLAPLTNWLVFYQLNRPQRTFADLDLREFLEGAKHALESTMLAMYSREFANFSVGAIAHSDAADHLGAVLEPVSLDALQQFIKTTEATGIRTEMVELNIRAAYVIGAQYDRVPRRKNDRASITTTTNASSSASRVVVVDEPEDERLRLQVCFEITEHVNVKLPEDVEPELVTKDNTAIWQFESLVTSTDAIEWRIEPLDLVAG